tara:strand:- start:5923 stop:6720 length:798 start_codon:yes stop_codon:yes gene_type:complete
LEIKLDAVILCGGKGTRLSEETVAKPKPMVEIGGKPILWHIMKCYSLYGVNKFILALGYKSEYIKEYFYNYKITSSDFSIKLDHKEAIVFLDESDEKKWEIVLIDTGEDTLKGARIKKVEQYINGDDFYLTYGDAVSDLRIDKLLKFHKSHNSLGTVTSVKPPSRFGELNIDEDCNVLELEEKPQMGKGLINGGFFVFNRSIFSYLTDEIDCDFEFGPLQRIAHERQLKAFEHKGFWQCMDNIREKQYLDSLVRKNSAPWVKWKI